MVENNETTNLLNADLFKSLNKQDARLILIYKGKMNEFKPGSRVFTLGRSRNCDIVIEDLSCSRFHAEIVYRKGKFVLEVKGINGTFVQTGNEREICVAQQEQIPLTGLGRFSMGRPTGQCGDDVIHFKCEYSQNAYLESLTNT